MKRNGNGIRTLWQKFYFRCIPTSGGRTKYIYRHKSEFHHLGKNCFFQIRKYPADPELISFGNNVFVSADVTFVNHDIIRHMLNAKYSCNDFAPYIGCIEIGDNVMIGTHCIIMPNVKIGSNVIIGAGAVVTKDIPDNTVWGGVPAKQIGDFDTILAKRKMITRLTTEEAWAKFTRDREK